MQMSRVSALHWFPLARLASSWPFNDSFSTVTLEQEPSPSTVSLETTQQVREELLP